MAGIGPNKRPTALIFQNLALFPLGATGFWILFMIVLPQLFMVTSRSFLKPAIASAAVLEEKRRGAEERVRTFQQRRMFRRAAPATD